MAEFLLRGVAEFEGWVNAYAIVCDFYYFIALQALGLSAGYKGVSDSWLALTYCEHWYL